MVFLEKGLLTLRARGADLITMSLDPAGCVILCIWVAAYTNWRN